MILKLFVRRELEESWREAVVRIAKQYGLEAECLEAFDEYLEDGVDEARAAWCALYDWDCLDYRE